MSEVANISSGSDTSDGDSSDLEIADIGRKLEKVELQLMQKQEIAEHFEVLSEAIDQSSTVSFFHCGNLDFTLVC